MPIVSAAALAARLLHALFHFFAAAFVGVLPALYTSVTVDKTYVKVIGRWGEESLPGVADPGQALSQLRKLHISHILDAPWASGSFVVPEHSKGLTLVFERGDQRIYRGE